jgi:hypothetical protein
MVRAPSPPGSPERTSFPRGSLRSASGVAPATATFPIFSAKVSTAPTIPSSDRLTCVGQRTELWGHSHGSGAARDGCGTPSPRLERILSSRATVERPGGELPPERLLRLRDSRPLARAVCLVQHAHFVRPVVQVNVTTLHGRSPVVLGPRVPLPYLGASRHAANRETDLLIQSGNRSFCQNFRVPLSCTQRGSCRAQTWPKSSVSSSTYETGRWLLNRL